MVTLCTTTDVTNKTGIGANEDILASTGWIEQFIEEAEGVVISETRTDWITGYADVNAYNKFLLRECVSSHAAKAIVNYDTSGFFSRQAAEVTLNVLDDQFNRSLATLKDLDTQKLRDVR